MLYKTIISRFSTYSHLHQEVAKNLKGKSTGAQEWLKRQLSDPYVKKARFHNFRCRSAFKLLQIDDKYSILKPGHTIIDCGAAPGSWCQVSAVRTNSNLKNPNLPKGKVIGIDILNIYPIDGVTIIAPNDFTDPKTQNKIIEALNNEKADVVLSDMAPNSSGIKELDHDKMIDLLFVFMKFAIMNTKIGGTCLLKLWNGKRLSEVENTLNNFYLNVKHVKPEASRLNSAEVYLLARNFKGVSVINAATP